MKDFVIKFYDIVYSLNNPSIRALFSQVPKSPLVFFYSHVPNWMLFSFNLLCIASHITIARTYLTILFGGLKNDHNKTGG